MSLIAQVYEVKSLATEKRNRMFQLFESYFQNATRPIFETDLCEKQWVFLLIEESSGEIQGFSTLRIMEDEVDGIPLRAFFSGDTIIHPAHRGSLALERAWIAFTFQHAFRNSSFRYFWFLIVNSYRSFRYLPVYAKKYYPNPDSDIPEFEQKVLSKLATKRYGQAFDVARGVVRLSNPCPVREGVADIGEEELKNPAIAFFHRCNPEWKNGTELACLAEFSLDNIHRYGLRILREILKTGGADGTGEIRLRRKLRVMG